MIIYKITNLVNGKIYIGQTVGTLKARWSGHCCRGNLLTKAIKKYSKEYFKKEVIFETENFDELNRKEIEFIKKYDSLHPLGYNIEEGGKYAPPSIEIPIRCLNNGIVYRSTLDASRNLSIGSGSIYKQLKGKQKYAKGFEFRYLDENLSKNINYDKKELKKKAIRCIETGKEFESISEASRYFNMKSNSGICDILKGRTKSTYGLSFCYVDQKHKIDLNHEQRNQGGRTPVRCIENNTTYSSIKDAAKFLNINSSNKIGNQIRGDQKQVKGYHFEYVSLDQIKTIVFKKQKFNTKKIKCINNKIIYESIVEAANELNLRRTGICKQLRGEIHTTKGYVFEYIDPRHAKGVVSKKRKSIKKSISCLNNKTIYESITEAAEKLNIDKSDICRNLKNKKKSVRGYRFEYVNKR